MDTATAEANRTEANKAFVREYVESLSGKPKSVAALKENVGAKTLLEHVETFEAAFPAYEVLLDDILAEGDKVAIRARLRGTHGGTFAGLAPTGKTVEAPFIAIYELAEGRVTDFWIQIDTLSLMQQLGARP
jgi:predicted ester cyclase